MLRILFILVLLTSSAAAQENTTHTGAIKSITLEGAPIATKHFQFDDENFRERHTLVVAKIHTKKYGNWGLYYLGPNSVNDTSIGVGYVTNPYSIPVYKQIALELSGGLGLVTGYQDYPVPLLVGQARLKLFESGNWDGGISMAALPYYVEDDSTGDNGLGIVTTTPFLSVRYNF